MPNIEIPYEVALTRHPDQVNACIDQVRSGKSKDRNTDPATWQWTYSWATRIEATPFERLLREGPKDQTKMTAEQRTADQVVRSLPVWLRGTPPNKRTHGSTGLEPTFFPDEAREQIRKSFEEQLAEEQRMASLTDAERQAEVAGLLQQLRKGKGFMELVVKR